MKKKDEDLRNWMLQHCDQCKQEHLKCITPDGTIVGDNDRCWIGKEDKRVFCPYNPVSAFRYKMMKIFQRRSAELSNEVNK